MMRLFFGLASLMLFSSLGQAGEQCGSQVGTFNQLASQFLIPDSFPPDNELAALLAEAEIKRCSNLALVNLGSSCLEHDACYSRQDDKAYCDQKLEKNWLAACRNAYASLSRDGIICRFSCEAFVMLLAEAQRFQSQDLCPSCDAYAAASNLSFGNLYPTGG